MATRKLLNQHAPISSPSSPLPSSSFTSAAREPPLFFSTLDTSMLLTIIFLLTTIFLISLFTYYLRRFSLERGSIEISSRSSRRQRRGRRSASTTSHQSLASSSHGLDISTIHSLPIFSYNAKTKDKGRVSTSTSDCCICLSEFEEEEAVKVIPYCGHVFHLECIDTWLISNVSCPLCRSIQLFPSKVIKRPNQVDCQDGLPVSSGEAITDRETQVSPSSPTATGVRRSSSCSELQRSPSSSNSEQCTFS